MPMSFDRCSIPKTMVGGVTVACLGRPATADLIVDAALRRRGYRCLPALFTSANGQVLSLASRTRAMRRLLALLDLVSADGQPMVIASRYLTNAPLPERVATTDLFHDVAARAIQHQLTFYFLGATASENAAAVARVRARYPDLSIAGSHDGFFSANEEAEICTEIAALRPDVLWVSMGVPREQEFAVRNRYALRGVGVIKTSGGLLNFLSGRCSRAPRWMQDAGLEWLYRLALEPRRLLWRYASTNVHAAYLLLTHTRAV
jgi:exopolysaccharide biosynthesis WecB/TagA/CpsF family protein